MAASAAAWLYWPQLQAQLPAADIRDTTSAILGVDATMLGFLVSTGALVIAIAQTTLIQNLYRTGHMQKLLAALFTDAALFLAALCVALFGLVTPTSDVQFRLLVCINVAAIVALLPVGSTMWHLLIHAGPKDKTLDLE